MIYLNGEQLLIYSKTGPATYLSEYPKVAEILDTKHIATSSMGYTPELDIYEISDMKLMLKSLLPDDVEVNITIDDISLRSN